MNKIIGIGNALVDVLATIESDELLKEMQLPKGSMQLIDEDKLQIIKTKFAEMHTHQATGGSVGNAILALANLSMPVGLVGKVGRDSLGEFFKNNCREHGIDARLKECDSPSGVASTFISPDGERTFGTFLGAAGSMLAEDLSPETFSGYDCLFVEGYLVQNHELVLRAMELAKTAGMKVCLDLASYNIVEADHAFISQIVDEFVDIVFANEEEAKAFSKADVEGALADLACRCEVAVVKVGPHGAYIKRGNECVHVAAKEVQTVVDTTAAGDFFAAGFLYGYVQELPLDKCGRIGSELSGQVIQIVGTALPQETWNEIKLNINTILSE